MSDKRLLFLPKIKIHNANALSSPYTIGFPAMTAWMGFVHALQRKLNNDGYHGIVFESVAVVCHDFNLQVHKGAGDFVHSIIGTGNPLNKDGDRSAFIEEGRVHLTVTLIVEFDDCAQELDADEEREFIQKVESFLSVMKIAGGDVFQFESPFSEFVDEEDQREVNACLRKLMPGYVLIERRELMLESMAAGRDALDAMLEYLTVTHSCNQAENGDIDWHSQRKVPGWIVPIATGFHALSELGSAKNQRDPDVPHCFAESVVTLGEFVMPHRVKNIDEILWGYHFDAENKLYLCQQKNRI